MHVGQTILYSAFQDQRNMETGSDNGVDLANLVMHLTEFGPCQCITKEQGEGAHLRRLGRDQRRRGRLGRWRQPAARSPPPAWQSPRSKPPPQLLRGAPGRAAGRAARPQRQSSPRRWAPQDLLHRPCKSVSRCYSSGDLSADLSAVSDCMARRCHSVKHMANVGGCPEFHYSLVCDNVMWVLMNNGGSAGTTQILQNAVAPHCAPCAWVAGMVETASIADGHHLHARTSRNRNESSAHPSSKLFVAASFRDGTGRSAHQSSELGEPTQRQGSQQSRRSATRRPRDRGLPCPPPDPPLLPRHRPPCHCLTQRPASPAGRLEGPQSGRQRWRPLHHRLLLQCLRANEECARQKKCKLPILPDPIDPSNR